MAAKNIDPLGNGIDSKSKSLETGAQDWNYSCGVCHVGGGQMEYDRDRNPYSASSPSGDANYYSYINGAIVPGFMSDTNKAEVDCLLCHLNDGSGMSGNGRAWLQSMGCGAGMPLGPLNDPACTGTSGMPGVPAAGSFTPGTDYDMYNRNLALKMFKFDWAASMGIGATVTWDMSGNPTGITGVPSTISENNIQATPKSQNCSVCHARDDNTPGLPGMVSMKYGYGNYAMLLPAGEGADIDKAADLTVANDVLWFELGCKTGMGKRAHRIGAGPNANWGMSMFNYMFGLNKNPGDPVVTETLTATNPFFAGMQVNTRERMPDADVHDMGGMQCASCHYTLGSGGSITIPAGTHHGVAYPAETIYGIDHKFAQADSLKDTYGMNNLDGTVSCESCHTHRDHPKLVENGGTLVAPTPTHAGFPSLHLSKIACSTCHIPETYSAPGRLKYRDHSVGYYKKGVETNGGFRNMLDWNFDLITGSHKTVPSLFVWATKEGEKKITPVLPSEMPIWVTGNLGGNGQAGSETGLSPDSLPTATSPAPAKSRDVIIAARASEAAGVLRRTNTINGGNMIPLFDGFSLADAWSVDTLARQNDMATRGGFAKLKVFHAAFDVTHGVVNKEWALGGSKRGGCVSCHSSVDPYSRNAQGMPVGSNPNYTPNSIGLFEGYQQPLQGTGFGIGQYDLVKNWFSIFADYDCTAYCGLGMKTDADFFDPAGNPIRTAACTPGNPMGWSNLGQCVDFMSSTFDTAMGFPSGTAAMMGMNDGIAGLQGFVVRETVSGATLGCQPFLGAESFVPAQFTGYSVNNCMPANNPMFTMGSCVGANPPMMQPGQCDAMSFRSGGMCFADSDCNGRTWPAEEYAKNNMGLIYSRDEVRKNFKINIQSAGKLTWPIAIEKNPTNSAHVASWDQANYCVTNMGMPIACGTVDPMCQMQNGVDNTCVNVRTWINQNELLGYPAGQLAMMTNPGTAGITKPLASISWSLDAVTSNKVNFNAAASVCGSGTCTYSWDFGQTGGTTTGGTSTTPTHTYTAAGSYNVTLTVTNVTTGLTSRATSGVSTKALNAAPVASRTALAVSGFTVTFTDQSTDDAALPANAVKVNWGDRTVSTGAAGSVFSHTYATAGSYVVAHKVKDAGGLVKTSWFMKDTDRNPATPDIKVYSESVTVPAKYQVQGRVLRLDGTTPMASVSIRLKLGGVVKKMTTTGVNGYYTFKGVVPGNYTVEAVKTGYVFVSGSADVTNANLTGVDFTANK